MDDTGSRRSSTKLSQSEPSIRDSQLPCKAISFSLLSQVQVEKDAEPSAATQIDKLVTRCASCLLLKPWLFIRPGYLFDAAKK
jgi:hypothetical protein